MGQGGKVEQLAARLDRAEKVVHNALKGTVVRVRKGMKTGIEGAEKQKIARETMDNLFSDVKYTAPVPPPPPPSMRPGYSVPLEADPTGAGVPTTPKVPKVGRRQKPSNQQNLFGPEVPLEGTDFQAAQAAKRKARGTPKPDVGRRAKVEDTDISELGVSVTGKTKIRDLSDDELRRIAQDVAERKNQVNQAEKEGRGIGFIDQQWRIDTIKAALKGRRTV